MTELQDDIVLPIDDLLARIRACIAETPSEAIVSLTINVERAGETTTFRLRPTGRLFEAVRPDGRLMSLSAEEPASSPSPPLQQPPSTSSPPPHDPPARRDEPQLSDDVEMDHGVHSVVCSCNEVIDEESKMDEVEGDEADTRQHFASEDVSEKTAPASIDNTQTSSSGDNIRRSA